ncbi:MAG: MerC domain-containing protein [Oleispira antarctica]|uniref:MerC domain-containing protein n=1 Tax=Oleispira antarctica RB-8 TaxID=698738 RepID=R4YJQ3_OLEAN|nr:MerC domain-containing protein [Oleispira antarctica]MBQ0792945.1 MerC domain-containing protein [Oleispira antarctica]CCK74340.1 conserved hypothetical protein [Oleispira antarctica RB-8]
MKSASINIDKVAIGLSTVCTVHCLLLPIILVMLPALSTNIFGDEVFHQWLLIAVIPTSLIALTMGCRQHKNLSVMIFGLLGLAILIPTAFFGHDLLGEAGEKIASVLGAAFIALGHIRNSSLCKDCGSTDQQCH